MSNVPGVGGSSSGAQLPADIASLGFKRAEDGTATYEVKKGDSYWRIAARAKKAFPELAGISTRELAGRLEDLNRADLGRAINPGEIVKLPCKPGQARAGTTDAPAIEEAPARPATERPAPTRGRGGLPSDFRARLDKALGPVIEGPAVVEFTDDEGPEVTGMIGRPASAEGRAALPPDLRATFDAVDKGLASLDELLAKPIVDPETQAALDGLQVVESDDAAYGPFGREAFGPPIRGLADMQSIPAGELNIAGLGKKELLAQTAGIRFAGMKQIEVKVPDTHREQVTYLPSEVKQEIAAAVRDLLPRPRRGQEQYAIMPDSSHIVYTRSADGAVEVGSIDLKLSRPGRLDFLALSDIEGLSSERVDQIKQRIAQAIISHYGNRG